MKKKLLLSIAIAAVLTGAFFQSKAASQSSGWQCRGIGPYICAYVFHPETGDPIPVRGQFKLFDL